MNYNDIYKNPNNIYIIKNKKIKKFTKNKYTYKYGCKSMKYYLKFASK